MLSHLKTKHLLNRYVDGWGFGINKNILPEIHENENGKEKRDYGDRVAK